MYFAIDTAAYWSDACFAFGGCIAASCTVCCDVFGRSRVDIPGGRGVGPVKVCAINGTSERDRRIVSWFYRWHDTPTDEAWQDCLTRFKLPCPPPHGFKLTTGDVVEVLNITLKDVGISGCRTVAYSPSGETGEPRKKNTPLGGLKPSRLISDAVGTGDEEDRSARPRSRWDRTDLLYDNLDNTTPNGVDPRLPVLAIV